jgi:paraquat-inducible protein B
MAMSPRFLILPLVLLALTGCERSLRFAVHFPDAPGLVSGDAVVFQQQVIGQVTRVENDVQGGYLALLAIEGGFAGAATEDSRFYLSYDPNRPGRKRIEIEQDKTGGRAIAEGATVEGKERLSSLIPFGAILDSFRQGVQELGDQLRDFQESLKDVPNSPQARQLEQEWRRLQEEMDKAQRETDKALREKLIPKLQQELDELRKRFDALPRGPQPPIPAPPREPERHAI